MITSTLRRCAFLSMDDIGDFYVYDDLLIAPMLSAGWQVDTVSWRASDVNWDDYEVVVVRSTWDYQQDCQAFLHVLAQIEASEAVLCNSRALIEWNINKQYLNALQQRGVPIVPTVWQMEFDPPQLAKCFDLFECEKVVIKPLISANADHTYVLDRTSLAQQSDALETVFNDRGHMIQPFLESVINEGEYSLFYFSNQYSHTILKRPKHNDFRVQEEHGGTLTSVTASPELRRIAEQTLAALPEVALYARLDYIRYQDAFVVMEVELIEPSLYFNMDEQSPARFVEAFTQQFG